MSTSASEEEVCMTTGEALFTKDSSSEVTVGARFFGRIRLGVRGEAGGLERAAETEGPMANRFLRKTQGEEEGILRCEADWGWARRFCLRGLEVGAGMTGMSASDTSTNSGSLG